MSAVIILKTESSYIHAVHSLYRKRKPSKTITRELLKIFSFWFGNFVEESTCSTSNKHSIKDKPTSHALYIPVYEK